MGKTFILVLFIPLYFLAMCFLSYINLLQTETESLEHYKLQRAVNLCVDAAAEEMIDAGSLDMDHADMSSLRVDPSVALDTFVDMFALNYDYSLSEENKHLIRTQHLPLFAVAAYDGYYIYEMEQLEVPGDYDLVCTPKLPYRYTDGNNYYALNLGLEDCLKFTGGAITRVDAPVSSSEVKRIINTRISDDILYRVDQQYKNGFINTVYIPHEMTTVSHTMPISAPTVLAFVNGVNGASDFSIGGTEVERVRPVVAYRRNGANYYCYDDLLPEGVDIIALYNSPLEAAQAGYYCDTYYMR